MSIHRRPVGSGRRLAIVAALVMLGGCLLPWYRFTGDIGDRSYGAFDGSGILVFVAALATLALVALPYASGDRPVAIDRWIAYALLAGVAAIGSLILARAAFDIAREPAIR